MTFAQQVTLLDTVAWVVVKNDALHPDPTGERLSKNNNLNDLFEQYGVVEYTQPMLLPKHHDSDKFVRSGPPVILHHCSKN